MANLYKKHHKTGEKYVFLPFYDVFMCVSSTKCYFRAAFANVVA